MTAISSAFADLLDGGRSGPNRMNGDSSDPKAVRAEFADAAQFVLQQRVRNLPSNRVFEVGWLRRIATYHRPIADPESSPNRAPRKSLRVTAAQ